MIKVTAQSVPLTRELVGRLASSRIAEVRARVAGIILKQIYTEGTDVRAGEVMFQIDPAPLEVEVHVQESTLVKARADADNARDIAERYVNLNRKGLTSKQDLDNALAVQRSTQAAVKIAEANLEAARLDLSYATVRAPIAGRAGRARVNEGALVGQDEATVLTTVEQVDPIRINFSQSPAELEQLQGIADRTMDKASGKMVEVDVYLQSGQVYPYKGSLDFTDLAVDPRTGAVSLRAVVRNPDRRLLPGMFVRLRLTMGRLKGAYVVPQASVLRDAMGAYVMIVNDVGSVEQKRVELQTKTGSEWVVTGDLQDGNQVIVAGLQKVRPGGQARIVSPDEMAAPGDPPGKHQGQQ
ncbi:MAG: efflux RND transporter periplasmic adaptor subunit [Gammaproteobacteria bacterium]|nr:efflux RND transporter periplasmic adaptor subunit [Gammaproteobacteria bacterium]MDH3449840.1 efflux RND transporter periplasmic adaptor subunit [Gammaproteobacteria bacterium]